MFEYSFCPIIRYVLFQVLEVVFVQKRKNYFCHIFVLIFLLSIEQTWLP